MTDLPPEIRALGEGLPAELRAATESIALARFQFARQIGMTHEGARDVYTVLGYDADITTEQYRDLYRRGGIAGRAVDAIAKAVWRGDGELVEDENVEVETEFEKTWFEMNDRLKIWSTLQRTHILASLSSFSVLLLGTGGDWTTELPKGRGQKDLLYIQPFGGGVTNEAVGLRGQKTSQSITFGSDVMVASWEENVNSPRFGQPKTYNLRRTNVVTTELSKPVHWSRIIHVPSEGFLDDAVFGPPALEGVWNYFQDLLKVVGGGSEMFWLGGNPGMHLNMDKDMTWPGTTAAEQEANAAAQVAAMKEKADEYRHQLTRWLQTRGVEVDMLQGKTADFSNNAKLLLSLIAGTRGIPVRILTGSERGELASSEDRQNWTDIVTDCRTGYAHPVILRPFIERLIQYGYMPQPKEWVPKWPESGGMSQTEKLTAAETMTKLNDHGQIVVTGNEVREFLGKEPLEDDEIVAIQELNAPAPIAAVPPTNPDEEQEISKLEAALRQSGGKLTIEMNS